MINWKNVLFKIIILFFSLLLIGRMEKSYSQKKIDYCFSCHRANNDESAFLFSKDVHFEMELSCADCHGGDPTQKDMGDAMSTENNFIGVPVGNKVSELCSNCHIGEYSALYNSVHAKYSIKGEEWIVQCTTCHGIHNITRVKNRISPVNPFNISKICAKCHSNISYIRKYNPELPTDQYEKYLTSKHGLLNSKNDPKAATCVSCHDNHQILSKKDPRSSVYFTNLPKTCSYCHSNQEYMSEYKIPTDQYEKYIKSVHGIATTEKGDNAAPSCNDCHGNHGAIPPGIESISKVCGMCHAINAELFAGSPHKKAFDSMKLPECETCHSNHDIIAATDQLIGISSTSICIKCHSNEKLPEGYKTAKKMRELLDSIVALESTITKLVSDAEQKGMEVSKAKFKLRDIRQIKLEIKTVIHAFDLSIFEKKTTEIFNLINEVKSQGEYAIEEYYFRRWGLLGFTLIIIILAVSLFLYIKKLENKSE